MDLSNSHLAGGKNPDTLDAGASIAAVPFLAKPPSKDAAVAQAQGFHNLEAFPGGGGEPSLEIASDFFASANAFSIRPDGLGAEHPPGLEQGA